MRKLALALLACLSAGFAFGQDDDLALGLVQRNIKAGSWTVPAQVPPALRRALAAFGKIKYSGKRTVEALNDGNRHRHIEFVIADGQRSRIWFPDDSDLKGQIIVETPKERRHYLPGRNELQVMPPRREQAFERIAQMANRRLSFDSTAGGQIANVQTQLVTISDKNGNVFEKLWIEPRSGMILKREMYDRAGSIEASFEFTEVNLNPTINRTDFVLEHKGANVITPETVLRRLVKRGSFMPVRLPAGGAYELEAARVQQIAGQPVLVQHYMGNGHRITLYQLKVAVNPQRLGRMERENVQIYSWQSGDTSFVIVGDIPDPELRELARKAGAS